MTLLRSVFEEESIGSCAATVSSRFPTNSLQSAQLETGRDDKNGSPLFHKGGDDVILREQPYSSYYLGAPIIFLGVSFSEISSSSKNHGRIFRPYPFRHRPLPDGADSRCRNLSFHQSRLQDWPPRFGASAGNGAGL